MSRKIFTCIIRSFCRKFWSHVNTDSELKLRNYRIRSTVIHFTDFFSTCFQIREFRKEQKNLHRLILTKKNSQTKSQSIKVSCVRIATYFRVSHLTLFGGKYSATLSSSNRRSAWKQFLLLMTMISTETILKTYGQ